jgi:hypothetical protein
MALGSNEGALAARVEALLDRIENLERQVRGLLESQEIQAKAFVVQDDRGAVRARFEMEGHAPRLIFYDSRGEQRLKIGLRDDGSPLIEGVER